MAEPFLGEIRLFGFAFAPVGWAFCDGQLLAINQNQALFSLLGTTYGGNGITTFALPDLRGRVAIHRSDSFPMGLTGGEVTHTLTVAEMPSHTHQALGSISAANTVLPANSVWAATDNLAYNQSANTSMSPAAISSTGDSQPHNNMQPFLVLNYCIALQGIFPSRP
ncbi:phage tail protein [Brevibacillus laterosporus]|uniref:phage tail protein n=1 Tax=Brevibacillus laterosporus TaxID=1465 RepID=UPI0026502CD1|nr:tail fiber protein [Brevibacillus laterosporus]MDN9008517.1 tail fiber protein [Brevibacillus laterosporus]MDO0939603.1 tail fiber protein [Brevibacillus laterosporus]